MRLLLDTHTFLSFIAGDSQLDGYARALIEDESNERYLSVVSIWEIPIKANLGRLVISTPPSLLINNFVRSNAIELLAIVPEHFDLLLELPYHHKDPFDRMIISQAIYEEMALITKDDAFEAYDVQVSWSL